MDNIYDVLRRYEFNKTESETLQELIKKAIDKGAGAQRELKNLARAAQKLASEVLGANLIIARPIPPSQQDIPPMVGIDGSCQQVGGFGGKWYAPISCAIVKALQGTIENMDVEVVANIEEIQQQEFQNVGADVSKIMHIVEAKAIAAWAQKAPTNSYVFLDGPVIDPPSEKDAEYINMRCAALKACLAKKVCIVGCVKRSFDKTFRDHAKKILETKDVGVSDLLVQFSSDSHLLVFILGFLARRMSPSNFLYTKFIPIESNDVNKLYQEQGLKILFTYLQRDIGTSLLRVEIVIPKEMQKNEIPSYVELILDLCVSTTYPGHYVPLLVQMAHEKCNIRSGCAEVLYDEIMTRARTSEPLEQIVLSKLR